jgi:hypothetical protein
LVKTLQTFTTMKQSNVYTLGLFFLVLLFIVHEKITVANEIRNGVNMEQQLHLHNTISTMMSTAVSIAPTNDNDSDIKNVMANIRRQASPALKYAFYKKNCQNREKDGKKPRTRAEWEKSFGGKYDALIRSNGGGGHDRARFEKQKKLFYKRFEKENFNLDVEYKNYLKHQKRGEEPLTKAEFGEVVAQIDIRKDDLANAEKARSEAKDEGNIKNAHAKQNIAKGNAKKNKNGAGRNRLSNKNLEKRARNLGIRIKDIKKFKEQIRSGKIDADFWKQKYPDLDLHAYFIKHGFLKQVKKNDLVKAKEEAYVKVQQETRDDVTEKNEFVKLKKSILNIVKLKLHGSRMKTKVEKTLRICDKYEGPEEARKCFD